MESGLVCNRFLRNFKQQICKFPSFQVQTIWGAQFGIVTKKMGYSNLWRD